MVILSPALHALTMSFQIRLTQSPQNCCARVDHKKKANGVNY